MTTEYIEQNRDALIAQRKHGAPPLPRFSDAQVETLLRCSQGADSGPAQLTVIRLAEEPACIDFFYMNKTLVTATRKGRVDVFDMNTARLRRTLQLNKGPDEPQGRLLGGESIDSVHVWLHYVIVSHGSRVTLWNHVTGELLEDGLETAHRARITGVFVLDDEQHLLSIDACGIMVVTDRAARRTLMDVPLYPVILTGAEGAPYSMRLLHMTHLCVWGRFSMGHYELYEPGLRNMPPLSSLIMSDADGNPGERPRAARPRAGEDARTAEARAALAQLESTHDSLEALYTQVAPDRVARASHDAAPEQRYHVLNIDSSIENVPEGQVLSVDFKHALLLRRQFMQICDFDQKTEHGEPPVGPSLGVFPVDRADHPEALRLDRMDISEAVGSDSMECLKPADPIVADAESTDDELIDGESDESDEAAEVEYDFDWEFEESGQSEAAQQRTADRLAQHPGPDIRKADLYQLESLTMRYIIGMQFAREDPRIFAQMPVNRVRLARARAFLNTYMPELLAALDADVELQDVMLVTPYYVQRAHEAKFPQSVELVDHRGQLSTARRLCADMQRVARVGGGSKWRPDHEQLVSPGVGRLRGLVAAMDDGRVAVGCENGYVVVTSFD
ncbi:hypothetical protein GGF43_003716 [Coemansia sp. RSA 2618]|nr:hypothetical protein GGF43_003716 [Coemansia sp. RSA 2618]